MMLSNSVCVTDLGDCDHADRQLEYDPDVRDVLPSLVTISDLELWSRERSVPAALWSPLDWR